MAPHRRRPREDVFERSRTHRVGDAPRARGAHTRGYCFRRCSCWPCARRERIVRDTLHTTQLGNSVARTKRYIMRAANRRTHVSVRSVRRLVLHQQHHLGQQRKVDAEVGIGIDLKPEGLIRVESNKCVER